MNREIRSRIKTAGEYQKKAIYALFPENVGRHLEAIERELKMMAVEIAADVVRSAQDVILTGRSTSPKRSRK